MNSRACQIATKVVMDHGGPLNFQARRTRTMAHACCEGVGCDCPCHAGGMEQACYGNDPLPIITVYPPGAEPLEPTLA